MEPKTEQSSAVEMGGGVGDKIEEVWKLVKKEYSVALVGEAGVGKTWLAREVCKFALALNKSCGSIWIFRDDNYEKSALVKNIARQVCIFPPSEESDDDDDDDNGIEEKANEKEEWSTDGLREKISKKLQNMVDKVRYKPKHALNSDAKAPEDQQNDAKSASNEQNLYLLAVLDDIAAENEAKIVGYLADILQSQQVHVKFLITRSESAKDDHPKENRDTIDPAGKSIIHPVRPLSMTDSRELLCATIGKGISWTPRPDKSYEDIAKNSHGLPAAIVMIGQAIKHAGLNTISNEKCQNAMEEATVGVEPYNVQRLLICAQEMLPSDVMKDCFWQSRQLFSKCYRLHYAQLITHWILEGFFNYDQIDQSYEEAHNVLMELRDRCFLKEKGNSYISLERVLNEKLSGRTRCGSSRAAYLGLANVLDDFTLLGKITRMDGIIKTHCRKFGDISTLIIDGDRLCRENQNKFFDPMKGLKVLAILNPKFDDLPPSLFNLKELQVLVLRGCHLVKNIDGIHDLTSLLVLEVSGAHSLENIKDDVFKEMLNLRSVNLSATGVTTLPETLFYRPHLRWLILRECKNLQYLPSVNSLSKLEVLDLSGSASLTNLFDKTLDHLPELQTIDLSQTKISKLPIFRKLIKFSRLVLHDCRSLQRLPSLKQLDVLEILDVSGAINLKEAQDGSLENNSNLRFLDLSKSGITNLPSHLSHLSNLNLSGCSNLSKMQLSALKLENLEFLDLSGVSKLEQIDFVSFERLKLLRGLVLSHIDIKELPSLSPLAELRRLVLRDCKFLKELEGLTALGRLEVIDLSGCKDAEINENTSFQHMSFLRTLNLSETRVKQLPSNCFPSSLRVLKLRNCSELRQLPSLESLSQLEVLDLYGAKSLSGLDANFLLQMSKLQILNLSHVTLEKLPSLSGLIKLKELSLHGRSFEVGGLEALTELKLLDLSDTKINSLSIIHTTKLQQLVLRDCKDLDDFKNLESFGQLEVLDLSGTRMRDFPYKILDFPNLRKLVLENMKEIGEIDWTKVSILPEELNLGTIKSRKVSMSDKIPSIFIRGARFFQFLKENEDLWQNCFQRFRFFVSLYKEDKKDETGLCFRDMGFFRHFNSPARSSFSIEYDCSLEILGLKHPDAQKGNFGEATSSDAPNMQKNPSGQALPSDNPTVQKDALGPAEPTDREKNNLGEATSSDAPNVQKDASGQAIPSDDPAVRKDAPGPADAINPQKNNLGEVTSSNAPNVQRDASGQAIPSDNPAVRKDDPGPADPTDPQKNNLGEATSSDAPNVQKNTSGQAIPSNNAALQKDALGPAESTDRQKDNLGEATSLDAPTVQKNASEQALSSNNPVAQEDAFGPADPTDPQKDNLGEATSLDAPSVQKNASEQATPSNNPVAQEDAFGPDEPIDPHKNNLGEATSSDIAGVQKNASAQDTLGKAESTDVQKSNLGEATSPDVLDVQKKASEQATPSNNPVVQKDALGQADSADFPDLLKHALGYAKHLSLIDTPIVHISQLIKENVNGLKSLWLELCTKIEFIICGEEDTINGEKLEHLYLSNLPSLTSLCSDKMQSKVFTNLLSLSLYNCPKLKSILPTSKLPPNLESLRVKFCYKVEILFKTDVSEECKLLKLNYLELLDLPNLKSIGASMTNLKAMKVRYCPKLEKLNETLEAAERLENLCVSNVSGLTRLCNGNPTSRSFENLKMLKLESCPDLTEVFISSQFLLNLIELDIKCCDKLTTICHIDSLSCPFPNLRKLHLWKLPELEDNWGRLATRVDYCIRECPKFCINS